SRLWVQQFGKRQKAIDFAGREIAKAAYSDRNSKYGWNVDHILPLSKGGKTVDYNLICCHILTNDEKADKFPCFKANEKVFEIKKRQNHYEIAERVTGQKEEDEEEEDEIINFLDVAQGLQCWKQCKSNRGRVFVGYVKIKVEISNESNQLLERYAKFLIEVFGTENIFTESIGMDSLQMQSAFGRHQHGSLVLSNHQRRIPVLGGQYRACIFTVIVGDIPTKEDTENLLDDCIILNTYSDYFINKTGFESIQIVCGMECYDSRFEMSLKCKKEILEKQVQFKDSLAIDENVRINTSANKKLKDSLSSNELYPYNYIFTELKKNLEKNI
ncbi:MAG: HNH endonuclease, partial [Ruminococcus flavefaciens]|nr:HNH endonuclease [Ruminococcus flavefaciens]